MIPADPRRTSEVVPAGPGGNGACAKGAGVSDQQHPSSSPAGADESGTATVHHTTSGTAVVTMYGEHDLSTEPALTRALDEGAAHSDVVVDLSECDFIDSTIIAALLRAAHAVAQGGEQFSLVIPAARRQIARIAEMTRLGDLVPIHPTREAAIASVAPPPGGDR